MKKIDCLCNIIDNSSELVFILIKLNVFFFNKIKNSWKVILRESILI